MRVQEQRDLGFIGPLITAVAQAGMAVYQMQAQKKAVKTAEKRAELRAATEAVAAAKAISDEKLVATLFEKKAQETAQQQETKQKTAGPSTLTIVSVIGGGILVAGVAAYLILRN